jgi:hypothetical protein
VVVGVALQCGSIVTESIRLTLVQILLQSRGIKLNPISTLYHIAPCCFVFLFLPFTYIELPQMVKDPNLHINVPLLLASAGSAFGGRLASPCCQAGPAAAGGVRPGRSSSSICPYPAPLCPLASLAPAPTR